jgi:hypothetical protein
MEDWTLVKQIKTDGPRLLPAQPHASPYLWADVFFGPNKGQMHLSSTRKRWKSSRR